MHPVAHEGGGDKLDEASEVISQGGHRREIEAGGAVVISLFGRI